MKIKIIYSGGKRDKKKEKNLQESEQINFKFLELSLLGDRNVIYGSENFLSTFEMLKEHHINPLVILRSFSKAARLSRYKYDDILCDLDNYEQLSKSLEGIDRAELYRLIVIGFKSFPVTCSISVSDVIISSSCT